MSVASLSHRLDSFAERRLSWLLPFIAVAACMATVWLSSSTMLVIEPSPDARRPSFATHSAERLPTVHCPAADFADESCPSLAVAQ